MQPQGTLCFRRDRFDNLCNEPRKITGGSAEILYNTLGGIRRPKSQMSLNGHRGVLVEMKNDLMPPDAHLS